MANLVGLRKVLSLNQTKTLVMVRSFSTADIFFSHTTTKQFRKDIVIRNIDSNQHTPLMVLIGWGNSKNKQLAKYSEIYEKQGLTTISVSSQLYRSAMFYDSLFASDTKAVIDALSSQRDINKDRKVFFQLFSSPGPAMYINIMNYYYQYIQGHFGTDSFRNKNVDDLPKISGVIFDSPTVACGNAEQFSNGMKGNSTNPFTNYILDMFGKLMFMYAVRSSKMYIYGPEFFRHLPVLIPQLMLFSKSDKIAGYEAILEYIAQQKSLGAEIRSHMWEDSAHVLHYRENSEEYTKMVTTFIENCITSSDLSTVPLSASKIHNLIEPTDIAEELGYSQKEKS